MLRAPSPPWKSHSYPRDIPSRRFDEERDDIREEHDLTFERYGVLVLHDVPTLVNARQSVPRDHSDFFEDLELLGKIELPRPMDS